MRKKSKSAPIKKTYMLILISVMSILIMLGGYLYYSSEERSIRRQKHDELNAIAMLKINQITQWRDERLSEAGYFSKNPLFIQNARALLSGKNKIQLYDYFNQTLKPIKQSHGYHNIYIASLNHQIIFSLDKSVSKIGWYTFKDIDSVNQSKKIMLSDFHFSSDKKNIHLDIIAPILDEDKTPIAVLVFSINPNEYLYSLIQQWPTPSKTSETLIFRKEGESVLYLNELRQQKNTALKLRIPLTRTDVPAVKAALGYRGIFEGKDYRGIDVLAHMDAIPGTNWFMVAKVDLAEMYSGLYYRAVVISLFVFALIFGMAFGLMLFYHSRQKNIYLNLYQKEKELNQSQEEFKPTLYSIGDGVITTDINANIKQMNPVAEQLTGWKETEAEGKPLDTIFKIINEENRNTVTNPVQRVLSEGKIVGLANHTLLISKDGREIPIADSGAPIKNESGNITGVVLVFRDQREERAARKALSESEEKFRVIVEATNEALYRLHYDTMQYDYINQAIEHLTGYTANEINAIGFKNIVIKMKSSSFEDISVESAITQRKIGETGEWKADYLIKIKNGNLRWISDHSFPWFDESGFLIGSIGVLSDINDRELAIEATIKAKEKAEEMSRLKSSFLANMSHELRTPLIGILGYTEILKSEITNPVHLNMIEDIYSGGKRLGDTLNLILDFSDAETNKIEVHRKNINISDVVKKCIRDYTPEANSKNLKLEMVAVDDNIAALLDERLFNGMVKNLINNAIKFTKEGSVTVEIGKVLPPQNGDGKQWIFVKIKDTGIGIEEKYFDVIFDEFRQVSEGFARSFEGNGLGLAISKKIAQSMGGTITVESIKGAGSTFTVQLPMFLSEGTEKTSAESEKLIKTKAKEKLKKKELPLFLYVEDDRISHNVVRIFLKDYCRLELAPDGKTALQKAGEKMYDGFLMDINLGHDMDGVTVTKEIKKLPQYANTPVIAITAFAMQSDKKEFSEAGCTHYLSKPFGRAELIEVMESVLEAV